MLWFHKDGGVATVKTLSDFITSLCRDRGMKIEDLQKKLECSRTTLYRYMKGINRITPDLEQDFIEALDMDVREVTAFSKFVSMSAHDQSLVESRRVLDDFLLPLCVSHGDFSAFRRQIAENTAHPVKPEFASAQLRRKHGAKAECRVFYLADN